MKDGENKIMIGPAIIKDSNCDVKAVYLNSNKMIGFANIYDYNSTAKIVETDDDEYIHQPLGVLQDTATLADVGNVFVNRIHTTGCILDGKAAGYGTFKGKWFGKEYTAEGLHSDNKMTIGTIKLKDEIKTGEFNESGKLHGRGMVEKIDKAG